jgi:hypothetical protein
MTTELVVCSIVLRFSSRENARLARLSHLHALHISTNAQRWPAEQNGGSLANGPPRLECWREGST